MLPSENVPYSQVAVELFCLLDKHTRISERVPKISQDSPKVVQRSDEHFRIFTEKKKKISEDCRRLPRKIRRCFDHTPTNLSAVKGKMLSNMISHALIKMIILSSHVGYSCYQFGTTVYQTNWNSIF